MNTSYMNSNAQRLNLAAVLAALLLSGCAELRSIVSEENSRGEPTRAESSVRESPQTQSLLNFAATLKSRNTDNGNELEALTRAYAQHRTEDNRLRLAIFHAITPNGDRARALALLDLPPGENVGRGRTHPVAVLLLPLLQENRRSEEGLTVAQQKLRDEQKRSEALQYKLDAIREIEKKMIERSSSPTPGKAP